MVLRPGIRAEDTKYIARKGLQLRVISGPTEVAGDIHARDNDGGSPMNMAKFMMKFTMYCCEITHVVVEMLAPVSTNIVPFMGAVKLLPELPPMVRVLARSSCWKRKRMQR